jgi:hypothetical protein
MSPDGVHGPRKPGSTMCTPQRGRCHALSRCVCTWTPRRRRTGRCVLSPAHIGREFSQMRPCRITQDVTSPWIASCVEEESLRCGLCSSIRHRRRGKMIHAACCISNTLRRGTSALAFGWRSYEIPTLISAMHIPETFQASSVCKGKRNTP